MRQRTISDTVPYVRGSDASAAAADAVRPAITSMEEKVYAAILAAGDAGLTDREIEAATGLLHQTASARRRGLVLKGRVRDSGIRRFSRVEGLGDEKVTVTAWIVGEDSGAAAGTLKKAPRRPKEESLLASIREIKRLVDAAKPSGYAPSEDLQALGRWLNYLAKQE